MNNRFRLLDHLFLARPILFFPGWATLLAGYAVASGKHKLFTTIFNGTYSPQLFSAHLILGLMCFTCAMGGCFVLNQVYDIRTDSANKKLFLLGDGFVSIRAGHIQSALLVMLSLLLAALISLTYLGIIFFFNLITGYFYNVRPFALKNRPVWGLIANMAMGWLAFSAGWILAAEWSASLVIASLPFLFFNTALYFLTTLPDLAGDVAAGKITFPVKFGKRWTINLCLFFFILAFLMSLWHKNQFMLVVSILTLPFMIHLFVAQTIPAAIISVKAGISIFALAICLVFPLFFVVMAALYFFTRFYYKNRFGFDYPNFKGQ